MIEVSGARASKVKVWIFARSQLAAFVAEEIFVFIKESTWGVLVARTLGRGKRLRILIRFVLLRLRTHETSNNDQVFSETSASLGSSS